MHVEMQMYTHTHTQRPTNRYEIVDPIQTYDVPTSAHAVTMATRAPNPM